MASLKEAIDAIGRYPQRRHIINISGGKDSAALAVYLRQHHPRIPAEYVFCDTGCELPETYEYLEQIEGLLGKKVVRLNALTMLGVQQKPNRNPFDFWLEQQYGGFLPSPRCRWCTRILKIKPFEEYLKGSEAFSYIGIRNDENREGYKAKKPPKLSQKPNIIPVYPFKDVNISLAEVKKILEESGLGLPEYYKWRSRSGCYFCFYQQIGEWQGLKQNHPQLFEKAKRYEKTEQNNYFTWNEDKSLAEIEQLSERYEVPSADDLDGCAICHI